MLAEPVLDELLCKYLCLRFSKCKSDGNDDDEKGDGSRKFSQVFCVKLVKSNSRRTMNFALF